MESITITQVGPVSNVPSALSQLTCEMIISICLIKKS